MRAQSIKGYRGRRRSSRIQRTRRGNQPGRHVRHHRGASFRRSHDSESPVQGVGGVRKAGFIVLLGSGMGAGVSFLATPFISRLYEPAVYGRFALITSVVSIFVGVSTFRLEVQSLRVADDADATGLIRLGLLATCAWAVVLTLATSLAVALWHANGFWLATGLLVFLGSLQLLGGAVLTRARRYRNLATANFVQGASLGVVQLLLGLISGSADSLLAGFGTARLGWLLTLRRSQRQGPRNADLWKINRQFAALAGSSALLNSLTSSLPVILASAFYGDAAVGQLAIGVRLLMTPLSLIGQSAASANIGEVGRMLRDGDSSAVQLVRYGMRDLLALGLIPCGLAGVLGAWGIPFILGKKWQEAGLLLALLSAGALVQFVAVPFSQMLNMTGNNRLQLAFDIGRFSATALSMSIPWALGLPVVWAIGAWSAAWVVIYGISMQLSIHAVARYCSDDLPNDPY
jgi:O-antigen/teichoic acid export membrane protein